MRLITKYDVEKDAENYLNSVVNFKHLPHGRKNIQKQLLSYVSEEVKKIIATNQSEEEVKKLLTTYLSKFSKDNDKLIKKNIEKLNKAWESLGEQITKNLEFFFQKPFPFEEITVYLTTLPISPYNYEQRYFYVFHRAMSKIQLRVATHELCHFMFYYYYTDIKTTLVGEKYELLKESITFFTNPESPGKPNEKPLRDLYKSKEWGSLDEAIRAGWEHLK